MARVTVEDCLECVDNRFELVMLASKRARAIATGGKEPRVAEENDKPTVLALRELADGKITKDEIMTQPVEKPEDAGEPLIGEALAETPEPEKEAAPQPPAAEE